MTRPQIRLLIMGLGKNTMDVECHSHHIISGGTRYQHDITYEKVITPQGIVCEVSPQ